ncbi:MAG: hypothetical protein M1820_009434, partial [Bogoriella megaspora]
AALVKKVAVDDYLLVVAVLLSWVLAALVQISCNWGLGRHIWTLDPKHIEQSLKFVFISQPFGISTGVFGRISFAATLLRLPGPHDRWKKAVLWSVIAEQAVINITSITLQFVQCGRHVEGLWNKQVAAKAHCFPRSVVDKFGIFQSSTSVATDLALTVIPLWIIWDMQLKPAVKVSLAFLLGLSIFAMITTIVQTIQDAKIPGSSDITVTLVHVFIWGALEGVMVIIAASMAALKPLFKTIAPSAATFNRGKANKSSSTDKSGGRAKYSVTHQPYEGNMKWDFERMHAGDVPLEDRQPLKIKPSREPDWVTGIDDSVYRTPVWESEERGVLDSFDHLPPPEPLRKFSHASDRPLV